MKIFKTLFNKHSDNINSTFKNQCINDLSKKNINFCYFFHLLFGLNNKKVLNCTRI